MPSFCNLVILFTRYPEPAKCKTRLIPVLGKQGAMEIHKQLVRHVLQEVGLHQLSSRSELQIHYDGGSLTKMQSWLGEEYTYTPQQGNSIGERMGHAFSQTVTQNRNVILIGSDCPGITASLLGNAAEELAGHDMVIGPAHDGGYYLIGLAAQCNMAAYRPLFQNMAWSTSDVFTQTMKRAEQQNLTTYILPTLNDIDTPEDLKYFHHHPHP